MRTIAFALLVGIGGIAFAAEPDEATQQEIAHLMSYLGSSGCQFNRNGTWYDAARAANHLNRKYEYLRKRNLVPDTETFIQHAASASSSSGKPYLVRCGNKPEVKSGDWFREALARFRATSSDADQG